MPLLFTRRAGLPQGGGEALAARLAGGHLTALGGESEVACMRRIVGGRRAAICEFRGAVAAREEMLPLRRSRDVQMGGSHVP